MNTLTAVEAGSHEVLSGLVLGDSTFLEHRQDTECVPTWLRSDPSLWATFRSPILPMRRYPCALITC